MAQTGPSTLLTNSSAHAWVQSEDVEDSHTDEDVSLFMRGDVSGSP